MARFFMMLTTGMMVLAALPSPGADPVDFKAILSRPILSPRQTEAEVEKYVEPKIPRLPMVGTATEWETYAQRTRAAVLDQVVYRGQAAAWRNAPTKVEWLDTIVTGAGYKI